MSFESYTESLEKRLADIQQAKGSISTLSAILQDHRWPQIELLISGRLQQVGYQILHLESADPFTVGRLRGKIEALEDILNLQETSEKDFAALADQEKRLLTEIEKRKGFQLRPGRGDA